MKDRVSLTADPDLIKRVREMAQNERRSFSGMVSVLLEEALDRKEKAA